MAYEAVRDDPEYNRTEHEYKDGAYWTVVLEAADRIMARTSHEDPDQQAKQAEFLAGHKKRERAKKRSEKAAKDAEEAPKSARKRGAA